MEEFKQYEVPEAPKTISIVETPDGAVLKTGEFKSPNYVRGKGGWKVNSDGNAEFSIITIESGDNKIQIDNNDVDFGNSIIYTIDGNPTTILSDSGITFLPATAGSTGATLQAGGSNNLAIAMDEAFVYEFKSTEFVPSVDNAITCGSVTGTNQRWSDVRSVLINGADIGFENGWKFREWPAKKEDVGKPPEWMRENANLGIQLLDENENWIAVFHKDGNIYCNGFKPLSELK